MAEYEPLKTSTVSSLNRELDDSIEKLDSIDGSEEFAAFKCYSDQDIKNRIVFFNQIQISYSVDQPIVAYFYANRSTYEMNQDDTVGICPMQKKEIITKTLKECEEVAFDTGDDFITKKVIFDLKNFDIGSYNKHCYQFVYANKLGDVLGVSTPFYFNKEQPSPQPRISTPQDTLSDGENQGADSFEILHSPEEFLRDRNEHLVKSNKLLDYLVRQLEGELSEKSKEVHKLHAEVESLQVSNSEKDKRYEELTTKLDEVASRKDILQNEIAVLKEKLTELTQAKESLERTLQMHEQQKKKESEDTSQLNLSLNELRKILVDKESEIARARHMVNEYAIKMDALENKYTASQSELEGVRSNMFKVLSDRRGEMEKAAERDQKKIEDLIKNTRELESTRQKQSDEIRKLESELHNTLTNLKNVSNKYQAEFNRGQSVVLENDKLTAELAEMRARMMQAREEYATLYKKLQDTKKAPEKPSTLSATTSTTEADFIDQALQKLQEEEELKERMAKLKIESEKKERVVESIRQQAQRQLRAQEQLEQPLIEIETVPKKLVQLQPSTSAASNAILIDVESEQPGVHTSPKHRLTTTIEPVEKTKKFVAIPCIMCDKMIDCQQYEDDTPRSMYEMVDHLEVEHMQKMCPVCSTLFDTRLPIFNTYFDSHIQSHFRDNTYPN